MIVNGHCEWPLHVFLCFTCSIFTNVRSWAECTFSMYIFQISIIICRISFKLLDSIQTAHCVPYSACPTSFLLCLVFLFVNIFLFQAGLVQGPPLTMLLFIRQTSGVLDLDTYPIFCGIFVCSVDSSLSLYFRATLMILV